MKDLKLSDAELEQKKKDFYDFKKHLELLESEGHAFQPTSSPIRSRRLDDYY